MVLFMRSTERIRHGPVYEIYLEVRAWSCLRDLLRGFGMVLFTRST